MLGSDTVLAIDFFHLFDIDFSFTNKQNFSRWKQHLIDTFYFAHLKQFILKNLVELPINITFYFKFSCLTGYESNLVYNQKE